MALGGYSCLHGALCGTRRGTWGHPHVLVTCPAANLKQEPSTAATPFHVPRVTCSAAPSGPQVALSRGCKQPIASHQPSGTASLPTAQPCSVEDWISRLLRSFCLTCPSYSTSGRSEPLVMHPLSFGNVPPKSPQFSKCISTS